MGGGEVASFLNWVCGKTAADTVLKNSNLCLGWGGEMEEKEGDSLP